MKIAGWIVSCLLAGFIILVPARGQQPRLILPIGHTSSVESAQFSPDKKNIVTASWDKTAKIWDAASGKLLHSLEGHTDLISSALYSPDGKLILTSSNDYTAKTWDAASGKLLHSLEGHTGLINSVLYSPDGKHIITASNDYTAKIWDAASGKLLKNLEHFDRVNSVQYSPDGKYIVTASWDATAKIWDAVSGDLLHILEGDAFPVNSVQYSPDGKYIVTGSMTGTLKIWDAISGKLLQDLERAGWVYSARYSNGEYIITTSWDNTTQIQDGVSGKLLYTLKGHTGLVNSAQYSSNGKYIVTAARDKTAKIWDAASGKLLHSLEGHTDQVFLAQYSLDGKHIITSSADETAKVWEVATGNLLHSLGGHLYWVESAQYSPDGKHIVTGSVGGSLKIWDAVSGKLLKNLEHFDRVNSVQYSPDGKYIVTASSVDEPVKIWNAVSGKLLNTLKGHTDWVNSAQYSPNGKYVVTASTDKTVKIWEPVSGKMLFNLEMQASVLSARYSPDGRYIAAALTDKTVKIWNAASGELLHNLQGHTDWVRYAKYSPDGKYIVTASADKTIKIWNAASGKPEKTFELGLNNIANDIDFVNDRLVAVNNSETNVFRFSTGELLYSFIAIDSIDQISVLPSGYYHAAQNVAKLFHYVTKDLKVITFEQLDVKYNRPDKVLEALGNTDTALIRSYRKAWEKRINKLGIDTTAFRDGYSVPECDFVNRADIEYEQKNGTLRLHIKGVDSAYQLDRFNVWVNEAPLFGQRGISIRGKKSNILDTTISIVLSQGENRIEASITNVNGTESYRMPLFVNYTPAVKQKETLHFIGIGIDKFSNAQYNLQYSAKDIRDLSKKLKEKYGNDIIIDTLFNENVTVSNVKALKQKLLQTSVNDKVVVSYSGHGLLSKDYDYYLSTYAVNFNKPEENGLSYDELENLLDSIPARKKLMLIDACHSGEVDKDELVRIDSISKTNEVKGLKPVAYKKEGQLGMKNSFELMQSLFVNVGKSTGATIISAAAGTQFALERNDLKNGVFTYSILEAMNKYPSIKISELKKIVGERVEQLTKGLQKPTSRNEAIAVDWTL